MWTGLLLLIPPGLALLLGVVVWALPALWRVPLGQDVPGTDLRPAVGASAALGDSLPDEGLKMTFAAMIRVDGFQCPAVYSVYPQGRNHYGEIVKLWCGERDRHGDPINYRLTMGASGRGFTYRVEPWHE